MSKRIVRVDHLARVEGRGGITVEIEQDQVKLAQFNLTEGPRLFEAFLRGRPYHEAVAIFPRICSICSAAHRLTAIEATEKAFGIEPTATVNMVRELLYFGDQIESHALHVFLLALPDFLGYPDALQMVDKFGVEVTKGLMLKKTGNEIMRLLGSREIHQENALVGGFGKLPSKEDLNYLRGLLVESLPYAELAVQLCASLNIPPHTHQPITHLAVKPRGGRYTVYGDYIHSSEGDEFPVEDYRSHIVEFVVPHSYAKQSLFKGKPYMVGALSRLKLNGHLLTGKAKEHFEQLKGTIDFDNALYNNLAQAIELVYFVEESIRIIDALMNHEPWGDSLAPVQPRAGRGVSITEAPRGLLVYNVAYDEQGKLVDADVITPTAMNQAIIERDIKLMAEGMKHLPDDELKFHLELVPRAYDPCISCSVHLVRK
ncbi:Ni/Fe hydrogenase subunit alpha [Coprothermobacteraceae bacterium]|nr:Ni/Fe hydrogenase subunit alpha [Coprothermobacteraceae bacterium]